MMIRTIFAATALFAATAASATGFTGSFAHDNDKAVFHFTVSPRAASNTVTLASTGYLANGFDTVLSIYDSAGNLVIDNDDGVGTDSFVSQGFAAGKYTAYLTEYNNFGPLVLPGEFAFDGVPDFRGGFIDSNGAQRTADYALSITGAGSAGAVPEPATWAMLILGFGLVGTVARRRAVVAA